MKMKFIIGTVLAILGFMIFSWLSCMLFPPTMVWQDFGRTPIADLGLAGKNIPPEKADTVYAYRVTLRDTCQFSPGEYLEKYGDDVAINSLVFTQDRDRVRKFMEDKGVKLKVKSAPYHPRALARR